ncbi:phage portal protein [Arthrobacter citreus]|nr:phage portal protein [Arthrobacter citreus]
MPWWDSLKFWGKRSNVINTNYTGDDYGVFFKSGVMADSGVSVNETNSLENTAVGAAVRIISESIGSLPFLLYERKGGNTKEKAINHSLYTLLHDSPNEYMTSFVFKELMTSHMLLWGNCYAEIKWDNKGQPVALYPLRPDNTRPLFNDINELVYETIINGETYILPAYRVLHIYGLGFDGFQGYSLIRLHREAVGLAKATEKYGSKYFGNGAKPGGVLETPGNLSEDASKRLRDSWNEMHNGLENAHRIAILEEGLTYKQIGLPPEDSQFLETRKFQIAEISRIFRVPLHMLSELDRSTNNNIEQQSIEFVVHTLRPWLVRWEQSVNMKLLTRDERKKYYSEHILDALLRGDTKSRYESYQIGRQNGWLSTNDIREKENMNPIPDEEGGNSYMANSAMLPISVLMKGGEGNGKGTKNTNNEGGTSLE